MNCDTCKRFALAAAHISSIPIDITSEHRSLISNFVINDRVKLNDITCMTFDLNTTPHVVCRDPTGFRIERPDRPVLNFMRWECDQCGIIVNGNRSDVFSPFKAFRLEAMKNGDVVINYPLSDKETQLIVVRIPKHFSSTMTIESFGSVIHSTGPCINQFMLLGDWSSFLLVLVPMLLQLKNQDEDGHICLKNIISLQNPRFTVIMGSYMGHAISYYINRKSDVSCEAFVRTVHAEAVVNIEINPDQQTCSIDGCVDGHNILLEFEKKGNEIVPLNNSNYPTIRYVFSGRTIHAVLSA